MNTITSTTARQRGFTMIEMIGVLAVIAILASIVAPKIFDAIRDSKINTFVSNIQAVQTATANYYKDTGAFPSAAGNFTTDPSVTGWNGPYLDKKMVDMFTTVSAGTVTFTSGAPSTTAFDFDIDADGTGDYAAKSNTYVLAFSAMSYADAKAVSNAIDGDGATETVGATSWWSAGRFKFQGVSSSSLAKPSTSTTSAYYAYVAAF